MAGATNRRRGSGRCLRRHARRCRELADRSGGLVQLTCVQAAERSLTVVACFPSLLFPLAGEGRDGDSVPLEGFRRRGTGGSRDNGDNADSNRSGARGYCGGAHFQYGPWKAHLHCGPRRAHLYCGPRNAHLYRGPRSAQLHYGLRSAQLHCDLRNAQLHCGLRSAHAYCRPRKLSDISH